MKLNPKSKIILTCTQCSKSYIAYKCNIKNSEHNFCSSNCYGLWQKNKSFESRGINRPIKYCSLNECNKKHFGKGYCRSHYSYFIENKKPTTKKNIPKIYICANCSKSFTKQYKKPKFCSKKCSSDFQKGKFILKNGYKLIHLPEHHRADKYGYVREHIIVLEEKLGRKLLPKEVCHHIDGNKLNNNPNNLINFKDHATHQAHHKMLQSISK